VGAVMLGVRQGGDRRKEKRVWAGNGLKDARHLFFKNPILHAQQGKGKICGANTKRLGVGAKLLKTGKK